MALTPAQEEFQAMMDRASRAHGPTFYHPEDSPEPEEEEDEESRYQRGLVEEQMRRPGGGARGRLNLPPPSFDSGRTTGVKGVIADARSFEEARRAGWREEKGGRVEREREQRVEREEVEVEEEDEFLERWREERRREMEREGNDIRNRRTAPSVRRYGRFDEVDMLGYLDAIEKVGRETVVVVFVYDIDCPVSQVIDAALTPLVPAHPAVHFVKVHYDEIEFDNAGVPAILAYRNQGDLFANLTYLIDQIPDDTLFDTGALKEVLGRHGVL